MTTTLSKAEKMSRAAALSAARSAERDAAREKARDTMYGLQDLDEGRDTDRARDVRSALDKVAASKQPQAPRGRGRPPKESPRDRKAREKVEKRRYVTLRLPYGRGEEVVIDTLKNPVGDLYKRGAINLAHFAAADRFRRDYEAAHFTGMRSPGLEPAVDGGGAPAQGNRAVDAQRRLRALQMGIGMDQATLLEAYVGHGLSVVDMHKLGGPEHRILGDRLRAALQAAAEHYQFAEPVSSSFTRRLQEALRERAAAVGEMA